MTRAVTATSSGSPQDDAEGSETGRKACMDASETATKSIKQHIDTRADLMSTKVQLQRKMHKAPSKTAWQRIKFGRVWESR